MNAGGSAEHWSALEHPRKIHLKVARPGFWNRSDPAYLDRRRGVFFHLFIPIQRWEIRCWLILANGGSRRRTRTRDLLITNQLVYQLSYFGLTAKRGERATR